MFGLLQPGFLFARNAPITTAGSSVGCPGGTVVVPVNVTNFTLVKAITLRLDFDPTQLAYLNYTNLNPSIGGASVNMVNISPTLSKIMIVWADVNALSLSNGAKLVDLNFTFTTGTPVISFNNTSGGGGECEYADEFGVAMTDFPTATYYINSTITNNAIGSAGTITGTTTLCAGTSNVAYTVPPVTNATGYIWTTPTGGSVISGGNTNSILVNYSTSAVSGNITVKGTNSCGQGTPSSLAVTVNLLPVPVITGAGSVCAGSTGNAYSTAAGMTGYTWVISAGGTITSGSATNSVQVTWNTAGAQTLSVNYANSNGCVASTPTVKPVTVNPLPVPTITGPGSVCVGSTNVSYSTQAAMSVYSWTVSAGGIITAGSGTNTVTVNWITVGPQTVSVNYAIPATGCAAATPTILPVTVNPLPLPALLGPSPVCAGSTGNVYFTDGGMTNYLWTISAGGSITTGGGTTDNAVTVTWNTAGPQTVTLNYTNLNGCTAAAPVSKTVTVNPLPIPAISGANAVCSGSTGNIYITDPGMTNYTWTVSAGGTISSGGGTSSNTVTVTWNTAGPQSVAINYTNANGCTAQSPSVLNVTVNPLPSPTISGLVSVCEATTGVSYTTEGGMANYSWSVSAGGSITAGSGSNSVTVSWNAPGAQSISVNYTNGFGCTANAPTTKNITVAPLPSAAGYITGSPSVCAGDNGIPYSTTTIPNTTWYIWTIPAGASIASGTGTSSITVNFSSSATPGNIIVTGNNSCGNGMSSPSFPVAISQMPVAAGTITGPDVVCAGTNGAIYSVAPITNATTYDWTIPSGAMITAGAGTSQIMVSFSPVPGTGIITVKGTSACGSGAVSPDFPVTMIASQAAPVVTANGALLTSSTLIGNQWYYEGTGAIAGATGQTYTAIITGWYWTVVEGSGCPFLESNHVYVLFEGQDEIYSKNINVYPVPGDGRFNISISSATPETYTIRVFNLIGSKIFERNDILVSGQFEQQIDLRPVAPGVYSVVFLTSDHTTVKKLLVR